MKKRESLKKPQSQRPPRKQERSSRRPETIETSRRRAAVAGAGAGAAVPAGSPFSVRRPVRKIRKKFKVFSVRGGIDRVFLYILLSLLVFGLVMLFSASYVVSYSETQGSEGGASSYVYIIKQLGFALGGCAVMVAVSYFDYHHLHKFAFPVALVTIGLLIAVLGLRGTGFVPLVNGAYRWIFIGPINFQPSEIAKFALILLFAHLISINYERMETFLFGALPFFLIYGVFAGLIVAEKHISATVILTLLAFTMMWLGGTKIRWFVIVFGSIAAIAAVIIFFTPLGEGILDKFSYAVLRIQSWLNPFDPPEGVDTWQTRQSLMAIGSGRLLGLGLAQSHQKYFYLPEPENDFIFAIVCEELGFVGALAVIILFALLVWRGIVISLSAKDKFGMLLGMGLTAQVGIQAILNICVVTNTLPNTGISLPFFSYGGTSLVMLLAQMGVVLSISRTSNVDKA